MVTCSWEYVKCLSEPSQKYLGVKVLYWKQVLCELLLYERYQDLNMIFFMPKILWGCLCELIWPRSLGFNTCFSRNSDKFLLEAETLNLEQVEAEILWRTTWSISSLALSPQQSLWGTVWKYWSEDALWAHYLDSMNRLKYILIFVLTLPDSRVEISVIWIHPQDSLIANQNLGNYPTCILSFMKTKRKILSGWGSAGEILWQLPSSSCLFDTKFTLRLLIFEANVLRIKVLLEEKKKSHLYKTPSLKFTPWCMSLRGWIRH